MKFLSAVVLLSAAVIGGLASRAHTAEGVMPQVRVLIIDGQNNHDWESTSPYLARLLEGTGRFTVARVTSPPKGSPESAWTAFRPDFSQCDTVLVNYNGELWPKDVQTAFERYVSGGGGVVAVHAANNAFPQWDQWNQMIGLGWRKADFGPRLTLDDEGQPVVTPSGDGPGAGHGPTHAYAVVSRDRQHPVMAGLPAEWMHAVDELYHGQRGPVANMHVLATAYSAPDQKGTGAHEPMAWWIPYGKGRVFTTVLGHVRANGSETTPAMRCRGFQTLVMRACEWTATGKVSLPVPDDFPTAAEVRLGPPY